MSLLIGATAFVVFSPVVAMALGAAINAAEFIADRVAR